MKPRRSNLLFILADDLGWNDLGATGSRFYESPHLDGLAASGLQFTQAYAACQVCSPSRASILTGRATPRHGITDWIGAPTGVAWRRLGRHDRLLPPPYQPELGADEVTLPAVLRAHGYRTLFVGKWHLGDVGAHPEDRGFDVNIGGWKSGSPMGGYFSPWHNPRLPNRRPGECLPLRLGEEMSRLIEASADQPFLAYLSFYSVHGPIQTSRDRWAHFRAKAARLGDPDAARFAFDRRLPVRQVQDCPVYAGMIQAMDEAIGLVLHTLECLGLAEETTVVFTSDNGGVVSGDSYSTSCLPLRGGKGRQWEGGVREPLLVRVPGLTPCGARCATPVSHLDLFPTLLELAGVPCPDGPPRDGFSLQRLLAGGEDERLASRDLFWHYPHYGNQGGEPAAVIRRGDWRLIHYFEDDRDELYDLATDPGEQVDLAAAAPTEARALRHRLEQWLLEVGARRPVPDPEFDASASRARLADLRDRFMLELEAQHRAYLDATWQPDPEWWGSLVTED